MSWTHWFKSHLDKILQYRTLEKVKCAPLIALIFLVGPFRGTDLVFWTTMIHIKTDVKCNNTKKKNNSLNKQISAAFLNFEDVVLTFQHVLLIFQ